MNHMDAAIEKAIWQTLLLALATILIVWGFFAAVDHLNNWRARRRANRKDHCP